MKKSLYILILLTLTLAACAPADVPAGDEPVSDLDPSGSTMPMNENYAPMDSDQGMQRGEVYLDEIELLTMESYPLQFMLVLKGNLPTPCYQLRIAVSEPDAENRVNVDVYSIADPDQTCVQVLAPFEVNYPLGSFPAGAYTLWVNGEKVADFQS